MSHMAFSHPEVVRVAKFSPPDLARIQECRHPHTRLGFAYQLAFVRLANRFPAQDPLELMDEILPYVGVQVNIPPSAIQVYTQQRRTIINHQQELCEYLQRRRFGESEVAMLEGSFLFLHGSLGHPAKDAMVFVGGEEEIRHIVAVGWISTDGAVFMI